MKQTAIRRDHCQTTYLDPSLGPRDVGRARKAGPDRGRNGPPTLLGLPARLLTICRRQSAEILDVQEGIADLERGQSELFDDAMARLEEVVAKAERKRTPS